MLPGTNNGKAAKNFDADRWKEEERQVVLDANSRKEAIANYRERYPNSTRSDDAIGRQFYELRPDKRAPVLIWTENEKQPILTADSIEEAIAGYQELFPISGRTIPAIKREWYELRPEKRGVIPCGRKKGGTNKTPHEGTLREKYQIPFSTTQNKRGYNHAAYICAKYDRPYVVAIELEKADLVVKEQRKAEKVAAKAAVKGRRGTRQNAEREVDQNKPRTGIKKKRVRSAPKPRVPKRAPEPATKSEFAVGRKVIHNGFKGSPYFGKVGKIVQVINAGATEQLVISFGSTNAVALSPKFVIPVLGGAIA